MKKRWLIALLALALFGCGGKQAIQAPAIHMSVSQYSDITERWYEETADGYKGALYRIEEITVQRLTDWIAACEPGEGYYAYIYADPDSWDLFAYYPMQNNTDKIYDAFSFCVAKPTVQLYLKGRDIADEEQPTEYVLIRIQAPLRGSWPNTSELYVDEVKIELLRSEHSM